jgi:DNA invertase Pin-like site-specific DNA recombinase
VSASRTPAVAYYRTSSATNVGNDKDSQKRQQDAVHAYAKTHRLEVIEEFYDAAVSGADPVQSRDGFAKMLAYMLGNGARIVLVENASRFARDLIVQITGHALLKKHGIELIPVDAPAHFSEDTPTAAMVRAVLGAVSEFEKNSLVARLRKGRDRKSKELGRRIEGNPEWKNQGPPLAVVKAAKAARRRGLSLRKVAERLAARGFLAPSGNPYGAQSIALMLGRKPKR